LKGIRLSLLYAYSNQVLANRRGAGLLSRDQTGCWGRKRLRYAALKTLGPAPALQTSSLDRKCKFAVVGRRNVGLSLARDPIRRNRSNQLKTGPDWEPNSAKGFAPPRKLL